MKRFFLVCICVLVGCFTLFAQNVTNVEAYQDGKQAVITYVLDETADVTVQVSIDGGQTFSAPLTKVTGDVGRGVRAGSNRIVWDILAERDRLVGNNIVFMVTASKGKITRNSNVQQKNPQKFVDDAKIINYIKTKWGGVLQFKSKGTAISTEGTTTFTIRVIDDSHISITVTGKTGNGISFSNKPLKMLLKNGRASALNEDLKSCRYMSFYASFDLKDNDELEFYSNYVTVINAKYSIFAKVKIK